MRLLSRQGRRPWMHPGVQSRASERVLGFLFSYAALISHESNFHIARENHLLLLEVSWPAWKIFVEQLDTERIYPHIDPRFQHGELRLSRLSKIYRLRRNLLHGYMPRWNQYSDFICNNFALLASSTVYIAIVLTAMQVGLGTKLRDNDAFFAASYGFTVFSVLGPLIAAALIVLAFFSVFVYNSTLMSVNCVAYINHVLSLGWQHRVRLRIRPREQASSPWLFNVSPWSRK
ncbi:hypothetical protein BGZ61DRAFT_562804, partial [Ilyonectria robusta]|uniref:uncharacterized protein n=1 Tax=Ilyonectria robusta TaxID=1079257 RepID=UPI001E8EB149